MGPLDLEIWLNHFEHHALHPTRIPQGLSDIVRPDELRLIAGSVATFPFGERSAGRSLLRSAERFARAREVPHLVRIIELLIREERRQALLLREFMQDHAIVLKRTHWADRAFRHLRHLAVQRLGGLELRLYVLISAELIGTVYYRALDSATGCGRLRALCRTIVSDELAHIGFESQLLLALRARRAAPMQALMRAAHAMFFAATAVVVWMTHRSVLRRAGHDARSFVRCCTAQHKFYLEPTGVVVAASSSS